MTKFNLNTPFQPKLLVFDLDGTLADTAPDIRLCLNKTLKEYNLPEHDLDVITGFIGNGTKNLIERAVPEKMHSKLKEIHERFSWHYADNTVNETYIYQGVMDVLNNCLAQKAVLTNKPIVPTEIVLNHFNISNRFMAVLGGDNEYGRKPDPAALIEIMSRAGVTADETLMIGDGEPDIDVAKAAGVRCCILAGGFGDVEKMKAKGPEYFYDNFLNFSVDYLEGQL